MSEDGLISTEEFAERRGVSSRAVRKAITAGRLDRSLHRSGKNWKIDPVLGDEEWTKNTNERRRPDPASPARAKVGLATANSPTAGQAQAAAIRTMYQAKLLELEFKERQGELVNRDKINSRAFEEMRRVRDTFRRLPLLIIGDIAQVTGGLTPDQRAQLLILMEKHIVTTLQQCRPS
jgi:hypothetical protein